MQASSQRLSVHRPRYWLRFVTDLGHKKRATEALRSCETALAEACPSPGAPTVAAASAATVTAVPGGGVRTQSLPGNLGRGARGSCATMKTAADITVPEAALAAVMPLGESLPLMRRAVRLAVPPLRWRKRSPPQLKEARLRVLKMDLSWRRRSVPSGVSPSAAPGFGLRPGSDRVGTIRSPIGNYRGEGEEGEEIMESKGGGEEESTQSEIVRGTSLEQAVLENMLAELGEEWTGLHAENR